MKLTGGQIAQLLRAKEDERVEFKRAASELPDNLWETYSAFCNTDGGITFSNPGTMRISKSVAVAGGTSDARNTAIFNIFALVDIGERSGMGLANLHGLWKKYGYAEPKITESYDPDRTVIVVTTDDDTENDTVTRPENGAEPDQKCPKSAPKVPQKCPRSAPKVPQKETADLQGLTAAVRQVYKAMCEDISMTHRGLESKLGLSKTTIRKATATLVQKGFIRRVGPKKGGHWEVVP